MLGQNGAARSIPPGNEVGQSQSQSKVSHDEKWGQILGPFISVGVRQALNQCSAYMYIVHV